MSEHIFMTKKNVFSGEDIQVKQYVLTMHVQHHSFADWRRHSIAGDAQVGAHLAPRYFRQSQHFALCTGYCNMQTWGAVSEVSSLRNQSVQH